VEIEPSDIILKAGMPGPVRLRVSDPKTPGHERWFFSSALSFSADWDGKLYMYPEPSAQPPAGQTGNYAVAGDYSAEVSVHMSDKVLNLEAGGWELKAAGPFVFAETDPCLGSPRGDMWTITTYYTPREETFLGPRDFEMTLHPSCIINGQPLSCRRAFVDVVADEGWGRIDPADPVYGGKFVSYYYGAGRQISDYPMGNRCKVRLVPWYSLATDQAHEIWWLNQAGFNELPNNSWPGGHVCGVSHDVGKAIQGKHIDLYVGVRARPGSGCADAYDPATFYVPVAVRTPQIDYLSGGCE
jgi:hypothetical protein